MPPGDHHPPGADFAGREFDTADFRAQVFDGDVDFSGCVFHARVDFSDAVFRGRADFSGAVFEGGADFYQAHFEVFANFRKIEVAGDARFTGTRFFDGPLLEDVHVEGDIRLNRAVFERATLLGPFTANRLYLVHTLFERRVRIEGRTARVECERTHFRGGVQLQVSGADILLGDCELGTASLVARYWEGEAPRLVTVSGTDMSNLTLGEVDLSACKFTFSHNLDKIKIEPADAFGLTPRSPWISRRRITGDERRWRFTHGPPRSRERWRPPAEWPERIPPQNATEVIKTYRALRKSREDAKDEPGAADFYYGEMDLRRLGTREVGRALRRDRKWRGWLATRGEYTLLWLYWIVSGYGLRAWRAFASLTVLVALAAAAFLLWGYQPGTRMDYADSVRFSLRAATSFLRGPEQKLTATGEWIELLLRFTGPVLFGLAILALRGRVKR